MKQSGGSNISSIADAALDILHFMYAVIPNWRVMNFHPSA
jgi:hypothetical protein